MNSRAKRGLISPCALRAILLRYYRPILVYGLACLLIYMGLWTAAPRDLPGHAFDEPRWLRRSLRADATFGPRYQDSFEINFESLTQFSGAAYVIAAARQLSGIPPEAVRHLVSLEPIDPAIRSPVVWFITGLSSVGLLILFFWLARSYGYGPALIVLGLMVFTPFWQSQLRIIMAEPSLFFFSVLALGSTLWLVQLLSSPQPSLSRMLCASGAAGLWMGLAAGVKANGAILLVGFIASLVTMWHLTRRRYFLLVWLAAVAFLVAAGSFMLTNPFLWHPDMLERFQLVLTRRLIESIEQANMSVGGHLVDMAASLRTALFTYGLAQGDSNFLPPLLSIPLFLIGLWRGLARRTYLAQASHAWLLSVGLINALIVPLAWDRYFIYTIFAVHVLIGVGAWGAIKATQERKSPLDVPLPGEAVHSLSMFNSPRYGLAGKISAAACILAATGIALALIVSTLRLSEERKLWKKFAATDQPAEEIHILNQIVQLDPQARWVSTGQPLLAHLQHRFASYQYSLNPSALRAIYTSGKLLHMYSPDDDLRARVAWDMQQPGQGLAQQTRAGLTVAQVQAPSPDQDQGDEWFLYGQGESLRTQIIVQDAGYYHVIVVGQNSRPAPIEIGVKVDGTQAGVLRYTRGDDSYTDESLPVHLSPGAHTLQLEFINDFYDADRNLDRNATIRSLKIVPSPASEVPSRVCRYSLDQPTVIPLEHTWVEFMENDDLLLRTGSSTIGAAFVLDTAMVYSARMISYKSVPTQALIGISLDGRQVATFVYEAGATAWSDPMTTFRLEAGRHQLEFRLLNISLDPEIQAGQDEALWAVRLQPASVSAVPCDSGQPPVVLNPAQSKAAVDVSVPVPALYKIDLVLQNNQNLDPGELESNRAGPLWSTQQQERPSAEFKPQPVKVSVDGMPVGRFLALAPGVGGDGDTRNRSGESDLPSIYLKPGQHKLTLELLSDPADQSAQPGVIWEQFQLTPQYPSVNDLTPPELGAEAGQAHVTLATAMPVCGTWKWYNNYWSLYDFYRIHIFGSTDGAIPTQIAVSMDNQFVGTVTLDQHGTALPPLIVELANGGTHTICVEPTNLSSEAKAYLYAVRVEEYDGPLIFAASSMRWDRRYNRMISTEESVVHLPPGVPLTKEVPVGTSDVYSVTVRYRVPGPTNTQSQLHFDVGGWPMAQAAILATPDWTEHTFTAYLVEGNHELQLWWQAEGASDILDIMRVVVE